MTLQLESEAFPRYDHRLHLRQRLHCHRWQRNRRWACEQM